LSKHTKPRAFPKGTQKKSRGAHGEIGNSKTPRKRGKSGAELGEPEDGDNSTTKKRQSDNKQWEAGSNKKSEEKTHGGVLGGM